MTAPGSFDTPPPSDTPAAELRRDLGPLDAVGIGLGAVIGAGIFVVTGVAAGIAGPSLLAGLLVAGFAATCNAFSAAQLAAEYPRSGGTYEYGNRVLGPWLGFAAGWMFLASKVAAVSTVSLGLAGYVEALALGVPPRGIAVGAILLFTILSYAGVRRSSRANIMIVAVTVLSLLVFAWAAFGVARVENFRPFAPAGWRGTMEAAALLFFAYTGYARIATLGEEVRDPRRNIPRAIVATISIAIVLYFAVAVAAVGAVGAPALASSAAPLYVAAEATPLPWVATFVAIGGVTAMLGVILSQLLALSRMVFAMARGGDLPVDLARIDPSTGVPGRAVIAIGAIAAIVAATGTLRGVASAAAFAILVYYGIANLCALRMPRSAKLFPDVVPAFGLVACGALAISLSPTVIAIGIGVLLVGLAGRSLFRRKWRTPRLPS